jgi:glycerol uptake facilitator-like aquaporin
VAVLLGVYSNLPWILPPYYTLATVAGAALLRVDVPPRLLAELGDALAARSWGEFRRHAQALAPLAWAYTLGSLLGSIVLAVVAYRVSLAMITAHRNRLDRQPSR